MECSIVRFSEIKGNLLRFEAEHYRLSYRKNRGDLYRFGAVPLKDLITTPVKTGHTPSMKNEAYYGGDIRLVKTDNLREFTISGAFSHYLSQAGNQVIRGSALQADDVIVTIIGATHKIVGRAEMVRGKHLPANINQNIALIRLKKTSSPEFLSVYLNSNIGKKALWHISRQTEQVNLNCREVEQVLVPVVSTTFSNMIESAYSSANLLEDESEWALTQAETLLLSELGLDNWQHKHKLSFVKNFSDTQHAKRIDADHFQPKYEEVVAAIKNYSGGWDILGNLAHIKDRNFVPEDETDYKYIELADISGNGEIASCMVEQGRDLPSRARRLVSKGDVIVSSIEGSLSSIALIVEEYDQALCSTGFHVVNSNALKSETLLVLLKSIVGQMQLKKGCTGTILTAISKDEFRNIVLPLVAEETQADIRIMVRESFDLRQQSKRLLECAKRAVEIAIEQDEQTAIAWLDSETDSKSQHGQIQPGGKNNGYNSVS